jgi:hypothetical protein
MALSPNYGWAEPDNSSLVKNGAQDIRALGDAIDTSVWNVGYGQAGKNKIINGDFGVWQRGTSFNYTGSSASLFTADRFVNFVNGDGTYTFSQQTFTPGAAPVAGYEGSFFSRFAVNTVGTSTVAIFNEQKIEDVRTFAGQTVTLSFWAKVNSGTPTLTLKMSQSFGSGGSATVNATDVNVTLSSTWTRYSGTFVLPSISGKTIGAGSFLDIQVRITPVASLTLDMWGLQLEFGSKATPFQLAGGGSPQSELAMCQRYFQLIKSSQACGSFYSTTAAVLTTGFEVQMRVNPTPTYSTAYTNAVDNTGVALRTPTSYVTSTVSTQGLTFLAQGMGVSVIYSPAVYIGADHQLSAEL